MRRQDGNNTEEEELLYEDHLKEQQLEGGFDGTTVLRDGSSNTSQENTHDNDARLQDIEVQMSTNTRNNHILRDQMVRLENMVPQINQMAAQMNHLINNQRVAETPSEQASRPASDNMLERVEQMMAGLSARMDSFEQRLPDPPSRPEPLAEGTSRRGREDDEMRRSSAGRDASKSLSLPICDGSFSFKGYKELLLQYFQTTEQPRTLETPLFLESLRKGNKQAKEFYQSLVDEDQMRLPSYILLEKAEEFFTKSTTTYEYVQKLNRMKQLKGESLEDWHSRIYKVQQEAIASKKGESAITIKGLAMDTFINGLADSHLRWEVGRKETDPTAISLRDLLIIATKTQEKLEHHRSLDQSRHEEEVRVSYVGGGYNQGGYNQGGYNNKQKKRNWHGRPGNSQQNNSNQNVNANPSTTTSQASGSAATPAGTQAPSSVAAGQATPSSPHRPSSPATTNNQQTQGNAQEPNNMQMPRTMPTNPFYMMPGMGYNPCMPYGPPLYPGMVYPDYPHYPWWAGTQSAMYTPQHRMTPEATVFTPRFPTPPPTGIFSQEPSITTTQQTTHQSGNA